MTRMKSNFRDEFEKRRMLVNDYLHSDEHKQSFPSPELRDAAYHYLNLDSKSLRPIVLLLSCGAVGGNEEDAIPAAAGIEIFHTWTLVHDDIIDNDHKRRGGLTVHEKYRLRAIENGYSDWESVDYGRNIGILTGDSQHGWSISLLTELYRKNGVDPKIVLHLIYELDFKILAVLIDGEILDIQYSRSPIESLNEDLIESMLYKKTGALYEYAGKAGAMIGLRSTDNNNKSIKAISEFTKNCGIAFQLQDDILGVIGDEEKLGKPVGSDIKEGKRTTVLFYAYQNADTQQRSRLMSIFGNRSSSAREIEEATSLLKELGGIERTKNRARLYIEKALVYLDQISESNYRDLLSAWAKYMIERKF